MSKAEKKMADNGIATSSTTTRDKEEAFMTKTTDSLAGEAQDETSGKGRKKKQKMPKKPMDKARKKKIIRRSVLGGVALVIVLFFIRNSLAAQSMGLMVSTVTAAVQDLEQNLSTSGTVKSEEAKTYFAPVAVKVGTVNAAVGDSVKKGQSLLQFDADALEEAKQMAQLKLQANEGGYASSIYKNNKYIAELGEANVNL